MDLLARAGALATMALGVLGLVAPLRVARLVGLTPHGARGVSELRATYGGLFVAMGWACLVVGQPAAFAVAASAWVGAALGRVLAMVLARRVTALDVGGVAMEASVALLLAAGAR